MNFSKRLLRGERFAFAFVFKAPSALAKASAYTQATAGQAGMNFRSKNESGGEGS
jgi:hypothetical protein